MKLQLIRPGVKFRVCAIDVADGPDRDCPAVQFLQDVHAHRPDSFKTLSNLLNFHANEGQIHNTQKSRHLKDGIYEFKSNKNDRLFYFYPKDRAGFTILTHGYHHQGSHKGNPLDAQVDRAIELRRRYLEERPDVC